MHREVSGETGSAFSALKSSLSDAAQHILEEVCIKLVVDLSSQRPGTGAILGHFLQISYRDMRNNAQLASFYRNPTNPPIHDRGEASIMRQRRLGGATYASH